MKLAALAALLCGTALAPPAFALTEPTPDGPGEPRMRHVEYVPDAIVEIRVPAGGETQIVLSPNEGKILFSVPQKEWRHSRGGNTLNVAPNPGATTTYAHAVSYPVDSDKPRAYTFELSVAGEQPASAQVASADGVVPAPSPAGYAQVRFTYEAVDKQANAERAAAAKKAAAQEARMQRAAFIQSGPPVIHAAAPVEEVHRRCDFMWRGAASLLPQAACNSGTSTTFLWAGQVQVPAIFTVTPDGREQSVTQSPDPLRHGLVVVPQTGQRWVLRSGPKLVAELFDAAFDPLATDDSSLGAPPVVKTTPRARMARR